MSPLEALNIVIQLAKEQNELHDGVPQQRNKEAIELVSEFILEYLKTSNTH
jgi:hypothetical protein